MGGDNQADTADDFPAVGAAPARVPVVVDVAGRTHPGRVRAANEDNFHVVQFGRYLRTLGTSLPAAPDDFEQPGYGFAVADGVGGHAAGAVASRLAVTLLVDLVLSTPDWIFSREDFHLETVMARSARRFRAVNEAVVAEAAARPGLRGMASTLSVAISLGADAIVAHVGDSPVFLFRAGRLHRLTRDHTVELPPAGAARVRTALTNAIGMPGAGGDPDVLRLRLQDRDRLLLCTDGLTNMVDAAAIADALGRASADDACRALVDLALARGGLDNVTAVVAAYHFPAAAAADP